MIKKIAQLADIQIRKTPTRNDEYELVFKNTIKSLKQKKPDIIVIVGDFVNDYLDLQGEQLIIASKFLNDLSEIAPVRITRGNHDCLKKNLKRIDSIKAIVETLHNPKVIYLDKTDVFYDDNIAWMVWHYGDPKNNPWKTKEAKKFASDEYKSKYTTIDLYHESVNGAKMPSGLEMKSKSYNKISDFKGDLSFFGHIHKLQYLDKAKTKAYCSSLVAQDFSEGDDSFHGYLLWDVDTKTAEEIPINNDYSFKNVRITPYTDFDDLDFEIDNPTKNMKIRFVWGTLPQTRTKDAERKLSIYVKNKYGNCIISNKNEFLETEKIQANENVTLSDITSKTVQHEIFKEFLSKIGTDESIINDVLALDEEILNEINIEDDISVEWDIVKFGGTNFMSYAKLDVDWRDMVGLFQITGENTAGKTTIMKIISYIFFGKTLETETRMKYGDSRFVNNRNNALYCDGYVVFDVSGEYYGIKKKTEINKAKDGSINGAPTTLSYYLLSSPDDVMDENTSIEKLDDDRKVKTQKKIEAIIGSYDNFMRIVMTTSDTLNRILSNDMAVFIDSLLFDSGLDIFDKKLEGFKSYQKKFNEVPRVTCNVEITTTQNASLTQEITTLNTNISEIETNTLPEIQNKITIGRKYVEDLTKKLFKIDPEIYNLSVDETKDSIGIHNKNIIDLKAREVVLNNSIIPLKETYNEKRLTELLVKKETHKTGEYNSKLNIKSFEQEIRDEEHKIEIINGEIFRLKEQGVKHKNEILVLKESKICPTCGQALTEEHQEHINDNIKAIELSMFQIADQIKNKENVDKKKHLDIIETKKGEIKTLIDKIEKDSHEMEDVLVEIGTLTNDKNDVEKRKELKTELDLIPTKIQNEQLKIDILQQKIDNYDNSLKQIEENHKIEKGIELAKAKILTLEIQEKDETENVFILKTQIGEKQQKIKSNEKLISDFKTQEYNDNIMALYKKCVHRDGIPRQMLSNYILPKINITLENILSVAPFKVWLDLDDLRPKLAYNNRPTSIIDCISSSGKERTFSSVVLKFALNQINVKSKPMIFLLDEVMGKLDENGIEEFTEMLQLIKNNMKRVLVIEQRINIEPDYVIEAKLDENGISSLEIE